MQVFETLELWMDPVAREGPEAMAVDEWLLGQVKTPLLRIYKWKGEWGSFGYFGSLGEAQRNFPTLQWVRRWTGGGTVDHRNDWTYTLVLPATEDLATTRGAESYRLIHRALAQALNQSGVPAWMSDGMEETGGAVCFENPVTHDLMGVHGGKLAGAGQRRTKAGLLHQGSVAVSGRGRELAEALASQLAHHWAEVKLVPPQGWLEKKATARYDNPDWLARKC